MRSRFLLRHFPGMRLIPLLVFISLSAPPAHAQRLSPLMPPPDWNALDPWQETISRNTFLQLLDGVYARDIDYTPLIEVSTDKARIRMEYDNPERVYEMRFAPENSGTLPRYWTPATALPPAPATRPLQGLVIALDPGHIGGDFAKIEGRWFQIGGGKPVVEGDMALLVAKHVATGLQVFGAQVVWTRDSRQPVTPKRPEDFRNDAMDLLKGHPGAISERAIEANSNLLFYRASEIHARGEKLNHALQPDLTLCLHFNAEPWGDPENPQLVDVNHLHLLVNGAYSADELSLDDVRFEMLLRLLTRVYDEELAVSTAVADSMAQLTGLPPYSYSGSNAFPAGSNPYVWGRNLLANRIFLSPVVYLEPYVMNSSQAYARIQAGDYNGRREFDGRLRESIFREYARGVVQGLVNYYSAHRVKP